MNQNTISILEKHAACDCKCDSNERFDDDCKEPCRARIARAALNEISEIAEAAKRQIDTTPNTEVTGTPRYEPNKEQ